MDERIKANRGIPSKVTEGARLFIPGSHFYIHLRHPRSDNEHRSLISQLQGFWEHFPKMQQLVQVLRPNINGTKIAKEGANKKWSTGKEGDLHRPVWTSHQTSKFRDLKQMFFSILNGDHPHTRHSSIRAYHPYCASDPVRRDIGKVVLVINFGPSYEHVLILLGDSNNHQLRKLVESVIDEPTEPATLPPSRIRLLSLAGGQEECWQCGPAPKEGEKRHLCEEHAPAAGRIPEEQQEPIHDPAIREYIKTKLTLLSQQNRQENIARWEN